MYSMSPLRMLRRSLVTHLYPIPCGMRCHCKTSLRSDSGNVAVGQDRSHVPACLEYPRGRRLEMDRNPEGQSRGYDMISLQTVPCHLQV